MRLAQRLLALEREGWEALVAGSGGAYYREHLAANAAMAFPLGVLGRAEAIAAIESAPPWERFEIRDPHVVELGDNSGVVVYRDRAALRPRAVLGGDQQRVRARRRRVEDAFHQQTPSS